MAAVVVATPDCVELCEPWTTPAEMIQAAPSLSAVDNALLLEAAKAASLHLYVATGSLWSGSCQDVARPSAVDPCGCSPCGRPGPAQVNFGVYPLTGIVQVLVDGSDLLPAAYQIYDRYWVRRMDTGDGVRTWPYHCQDLSLPVTEDGTWQVTYAYGVGPPAMWRGHATTFGAQIALRLTGQECDLPPETVSINSRGVTVQLDPDGNAPTGLNAIDRAIALVNPGKVRERATVWAPGKILAHRPG